MTSDEELTALLEKSLPSDVMLRDPTGKPCWPVVVLSGPESTGKTFNAVRLSSDQRLGPSFYMPVAETSADEFGALPGARYKLLSHDGSYRQMHGIVQAIVKLPVDLARPPVFIIDSISNLWTMFSAEADLAARRGRPIDAEVVITSDKWNTATRRWRSIIDPLKAWQGLVILTARADDKLVMDEDGRPAKDRRNRALHEYKIEGQKTLRYDADVIVRCTAPGQGTVTKAVSLALGIIPEDGLEVPKFDLAEFLFDGMQLGKNMGESDYQASTPEEPHETIPIKTAQQVLINICGGDEDRARQAWVAAKIESHDGQVRKSDIEELVDQLGRENAQETEQQQAEQPPVDEKPAVESKAESSPEAPAEPAPEQAPPAQQPVASSEQLPKPDAPLVAFLAELAEAPTLDAVRDLRSKVRHLPPAMRKPASEAVTKRMGEVGQPATT